MTNENTYIDRLIDDCKAAKLATHTQTIEGNDATAFKGIISAVYVIKEIDGDINKTLVHFRKFKANKTRACPKVNKASQILYVGSSVNSLEARLNQHIGDNNNVSTSALNLSHWFKGKFRITAKTYDVSPAVLQIIEDSMHYHLKPAFGKMGGNGK